MLVFAVGYNLWLYRLEPTSKVDPNDNPFQYALVDRTNQMWDYAGKTCGINPICFSGYLIDHWVPNWAQGYNLPYYYSHAPQIFIVASYRFLGHFFGITLYQWYHVLIYLLLCLFPISVYLGLRIIRLPYLVAGVGALLASHISTDGLYGLDPSSFLWRGYGLTSQLFAMVWLPIAVALAYRFLTEPFVDYRNLLPNNLQWLLKKNKRLSFLLPKKEADTTIRKIFWVGALFLILTISGHLGIGVMTLLSIGVFAITPLILGIFHKHSIYDILEVTKHQIIRVILLVGVALSFLSYWILPALINDKYHNLSFWDPVWKFNSWGWKEVMQFFFNGALFDFGRFPVLTLLIVIGAFAVFYIKSETRNSKHETNTNNPNSKSEKLLPYLEFRYSHFGFLFVFWLLMFFGRSTWGSLLDIIPSMKEFHQSRFIVGVHLAGFFLVPIGFWWLAETVPLLFSRVKGLFSHGISSLTKSSDYSPSPILLTTIYCLLATSLIILSYPQTYRYSEYNDVLIKRGNENFDKQNSDVETLITELKKSPAGRVYTGRGSNWGKKLELAETTYFMHLSTYGLPVILWLPETWSPNSDVEQFFIDDWIEHYDLMNVKYVVTTPEIEPKPFWKFVKETPQWKLYSVNTQGYFGVGSLPTIIESNKFNYTNLVRLWLQSDMPKQFIYPQLTFNHKEMMSTPLPAFRMLDEATYETRDGKTHGLFGEVPVYEAPAATAKLNGPESTTMDMEFTTKVSVEKDCAHCLVFLKQSFHPNWHAWVDGKKTDTFITFPFYTAIKIPTAGTHTVVFKYEPSSMKMILFTIAGLVAISLFVPVGMIHHGKRKREANG